MGSPRFKVVIPARYASTRFPGKVLADIHGKPMLQHVYERALEGGAGEVIIATEDRRVEEAARKFGAAVCMTSPEHASGSDRIAEVARQLKWKDSTLIVNVQGDEPFIPPDNIAQVAANLAQHKVEMATLRTPIMDAADVPNPNVVKVVVDAAGMALYFSRAAIPYQRDPLSGGSAQYYRHIGLYAYRNDFLQRYTRTPPVPPEEAEKLEQLRALWLGARIHVAVAQIAPAVGVDTPEDLARILRHK
ncbi:MAG TPA: 3-deoxy-manno-octulosonate cytidylyltransferase [Gammaproteobacteria bacterium]|nr:3-deoxy-manno-octulosonate cytidylyltransferase [Gammaproteobacteria bacterium]